MSVNCCNGDPDNCAYSCDCADEFVISNCFYDYRPRLLENGLSSGMLQSASTSTSSILNRTCGVMELRCGRPCHTGPNHTGYPLQFISSFS